MNEFEYINIKRTISKESNKSIIEVKNFYVREAELLPSFYFNQKDEVKTKFHCQQFVILCMMEQIKRRYCI